VEVEVVEVEVVVVVAGVAAANDRRPTRLATVVNVVVVSEC
jgi:hypothetical protein